jgi:hypothetical protein
MARESVLRTTGTTSTLICEAIRKRLLLEFVYQGKRRVVAPYCHGVSTRGLEVLRAVQVGGESGSGKLGMGKLWALTDMIGLRLLEEPFAANDPLYNPNDSAMKQIHCRV